MIETPNFSVSPEDAATSADSAGDAIRQAVVGRIRVLTSSWARSADLLQIRESFAAAMVESDPLPMRALSLDGIPGAIVNEHVSAGGPICLYFHGGGFQIGSTKSHQALMSRIARSARLPVLGIDYRLAPEFRFPAAHDDCLSAYLSLVKQTLNPGRVVIAGDSAGAHLALSTALAACDRGIAPAGLVLISPWLDLELTGESYRTRMELDVFSKPDQLKAMARTYRGRPSDANDPRLALLNANLSKLPSTLIHSGDHDITLDDGRRLADRAKTQGVNCRVVVWPEMMHHFQMFGDLPEAVESVNGIAAFIRDRVFDR